MRRIICGFLLAVAAGAVCAAASSQDVVELRLSSPNLKNESVQTVITRLKDPEGLCRSAAARELGQRKVTQAVAPLKELLSDPLHYVRVTAAEALLELGDRSGIALLREEVAAGSIRAFDAARYLLAHGDNTGLQLVKSKLTSTRTVERSLAIGALSRSNDEELVYSTLVGGLKDMDPSIRGQCIFRIGDLGTQRSVGLLKSLYPLVGSPSERACLMQAAARTGLWDAIPALLEGLDDPEFLVRTNAATYLNLLTGQSKPVSVRDPERAKALSQQWRQWWDANKGSYPPGGRSDAPFLKSKDTWPF